MSTPVDIISGFLGAGKTTLLNQMLSTVCKGKRIAIVENEFGDENIDGELLPADMTVMEMAGGCACCTIRVGLIEGLMDLIAQNRFDRIVIEPTGVAKLSEMLSILQTKQLQDITSRGFVITVVNPLFHTRYSQTLGDFYLDQIKHSNVVFVNRTDQITGDALAEVAADIKLTHDVPVLTTLPDNLLAMQAAPHHTDSAPHHPDHAHHHHAHRDADDAFTSQVILPPPAITRAEIAPYIDSIIKKTKGDVLRIKGFVKTPAGDFLVQWVPGELKVTEQAASQCKLVVIHRLTT